MNEKDNALTEVHQQTEQLQKNVDSLNKVLSVLKSLQADMKDAINANAKNVKTFADQVTSTTGTLKGLNDQGSKISKTLSQAQTATQQNKIALQQLAQIQVDYTKTQSNGTSVTEKLSVKMASLTQTIQQQETEVAKSQETFDFHAASIDALNIALDEIKASNKDFGPVLEDVTKGFNFMKDGLLAVKTGFSSVDGAIKLSAFGILISTLKYVVEYFTKTEEGAKMLKIGIAAISVVITKVKQAVTNVLSNVAGGIIDAFSDPAKTIENIWNAVITNIGNRFKGIKVFFDGLFSGDLKKMGDGVIQMGTGVVNGIDKIVKGAEKAKNAIIEIGTEAIKAGEKAAREAPQPKTKNKTSPVAKHAKNNNDKVRNSTNEILEIHALNITNLIDPLKEQYEADLLLLTDQLKNKLLTEQSYYEQSEQLREKYYRNIGGHVENFAKVELKPFSESLEAVKTASMRKIVMGIDEKALDKALLPKQKFDAEKKLIEDKYFYEKKLAGDNAEKIKQIDDQKEADLTQLIKDHENARKNFQIETAQKVADAGFSILQNNIKAGSAAKLKQLDTQKTAELSNTSLTGAQKKAIEEKYKKKEAEEKVKAFKAEQRTSILQAVVNGALAITKATAQTGVLAPFVIPGIIASTAIQVATIAAQKAPQYAKGGLHYRSDGKGAVLPGYSRTDNTNAYLRSGEAVVVSEAMRNPWARNLVSAINVAYGGKDFSVANPGRGYAIGGIFTDGGNSNRYYNQPMNDQQALASSIAYQMVNNFPPIYVDVKDVNNQQGILAQTINRVNL